MSAAMDCASQLDRQSRILDEVLAQQRLQNERLEQLTARQEQTLCDLDQHLEARAPLPSAEPRLQRKDPSSSEPWQAAVLAALQSVEARVEQVQRSVERSATSACDDSAAEFAGLWYEGEAKHIIAGRFLHTNLGEAGFTKLVLKVHGPRDFSVAGPGEVVEEAQLSADGRQLLWGDGRVWSRDADAAEALPGASKGPLRATSEVVHPSFGTTSQNTERGFKWLARDSRTQDALSTKKSELGDSLRYHAQRGGSGRNLLNRLANFADWIEDQKAVGATYSRWIDRIVQSCAFEAVSAVMILVNAVYIGYTANWFIEHPLENAGNTFFVVDILFFAFFAVELLLRMVSLGKYFLFGPDAIWYAFDAVLVLISAIELSAGGSGGYSWLRTLRVFKLARVIRMVRTISLFKDLRLMMDCMLGSFVSLFWCLAMISFLFYLFALIFVQGLTDVVEGLEQERLESLAAASTEASAANRLLRAVVAGRQLESSVDELEGEALLSYILTRYGSVSKAMFRLWTATTGGVDWQDEYDVIKLSGTYHAVVFIGFIAFMIIVVWNIVTSTILEKALRFAQPDVDQILMDKRRRDNEDVYLLVSMFHKAGINLTSTLKEDEFMELLEQRDLADFLQVRGIDIKEAHTFFALLTEDSSTEGVDAMSFIISCLRIKGFATSIDLHTTHHQVMRVLRRHGRLLQANQMKLMQVEQHIRVGADAAAAAQGEAAPSSQSRNPLGAVAMQRNLPLNDEYFDSE